MTAARRSNRIVYAAWLAVLAAIIPAVIAMAGMTLEPKANAATSATVTVTGTVGASIQVALGSCGTVAGSPAVAIGLATTSYSENCQIDFGSTNDPTQKVTILDNTSGDPFLQHATLPDIVNKAAGCSDLTVEGVGVHIVGTANNASVAAGWACAGTDTAGCSVACSRFAPMPTVATDLCTSATTSVTNHRCTIEWGVRETGSDLAAGSYTGQADVTVVDI